MTLPFARRTPRHEQFDVSPILKSKERVWTCPNWTDFFSEFGVDTDSDFNIDLGLLSSIHVDDVMEESDVDRLEALLLFLLSWSSSLVVLVSDAVDCMEYLGL